MRQTRRRQQQWRVFVFTLLLVTCSLIALRYGLEWAGSRIELRRQPVTLPQPQTVEAGTKLVWVTKYSVCGDEERRETAPDRLTIGQSLEQLQAANPVWVVEHFARDQAVMRRSEQLCPLHRESRTLKITNGVVVIYYGTQDKLGPKVNTVADLAPELLANEDRVSLEQGVSFINSDPGALEDMIQSYLEGISE